MSRLPYDDGAVADQENGFLEEVVVYERLLRKTSYN